MFESPGSHGAALSPDDVVTRASPPSDVVATPVCDLATPVCDLATPSPPNVATPIAQRSCIEHSPENMFLTKRLQFYKQQRSSGGTFVPCELAGLSELPSALSSHKRVTATLEVNLKTSSLPLTFLLKRERRFLSLEKGLSDSRPPTGTDLISAIALGGSDFLAFGTLGGRLALYARPTPAQKTSEESFRLRGTSWVTASTTDCCTPSAVATLSCISTKASTSIYDAFLLVGSSSGQLHLLGYFPPHLSELCVISGQHLTISSSDGNNSELPLPRPPVVSATLLVDAEGGPVAVVGWVGSQDVVQLRFFVGERKSKTIVNRRRLWLPDNKLGPLLKAETVTVPDVSQSGSKTGPVVLGLLSCCGGIVVLQLLPELSLITRQIFDKGLQCAKPSNHLSCLSVCSRPNVPVYIVHCLSQRWEMLPPLPTTVSTLRYLVRLPSALLAAQEQTLAAVQLESNCSAEEHEICFSNLGITSELVDVVGGFVDVDGVHAVIVAADGQATQFELNMGKELIQKWISRFKNTCVESAGGSMLEDVESDSEPDLADILLIVSERSSSGQSPKVQLGFALGASVFPLIFELHKSQLAIAKILKLLNIVHRNFFEVFWPIRISSQFLSSSSISNSISATTVHSLLHSFLRCCLTSIVVLLLDEYFQIIDPTVFPWKFQFREHAARLVSFLSAPCPSNECPPSSALPPAGPLAAILISGQKAITAAALTALSTEIASEYHQFRTPDPTFKKLVLALIAIVTDDIVKFKQFLDDTELDDGYVHLVFDVLEFWIWNLSNHTTPAETSLPIHPPHTDLVTHLIQSRLNHLVKLNPLRTSRLFCAVLQQHDNSRLTIEGKTALQYLVGSAITVGTADGQLEVLTSALKFRDMQTEENILRFIRILVDLYKEISLEEAAVFPTTETELSTSSSRGVLLRTRPRKSFDESVMNVFDLGQHSSILMTRQFPVLERQERYDKLLLSMIRFKENFASKIVLNILLNEPAVFQTHLCEPINLSIPLCLLFPYSTLNLFAAKGSLLDGISITKKNFKVAFTACMSQIEAAGLIVPQRDTYLKGEEAPDPHRIAVNVVSVFLHPFIALTQFPASHTTIPRPLARELWVDLLDFLEKATTPQTCTCLNTHKALAEIWVVFGSLICQFTPAELFVKVRAFLRLTSPSDNQHSTCCHLDATKKLLCQAGRQTSEFSTLVDLVHEECLRVVASTLRMSDNHLRQGRPVPGTDQAPWVTKLLAEMTDDRASTSDDDQSCGHELSTSVPSVQQADRKIGGQYLASDLKTTATSSSSPLLITAGMSQVLPATKEEIERQSAAVKFESQQHLVRHPSITTVCEFTPNIISQGFENCVIYENKQ